MWPACLWQACQCSGPEDWKDLGGGRDQFLKPYFESNAIQVTRDEGHALYDYRHLLGLLLGDRSVD